ncbi:MAG: hypothetical protein A2731_03195 [Candidatus Buchananbacteria bacterium RIFCSPHIGHO2_01_FULL_39_8]|uniref:Uncharacterized protein n=1 Tax=Candidatus Buchananbacteria bacterium RIFCSPHIGHO2_01_FULL_39_8 TaxID=1797533 RepID=A0A1G1Y0R8_9BACT|nr:MAG: hypothetical protein A2731_03195 [Candidatus Buchananbacteria bacterium RIFCSPHIGHO2_01_FULL_39_8]
MDYWSRITLASLIGGGVGFGIGYFFGNYLIWIFIGLAFAVATESSLRTIKNVKAKPSQLKGVPPADTIQKKQILINKKPPKVRF